MPEPTVVARVVVIEMRDVFGQVLIREAIDANNHEEVERVLKLQRAVVVGRLCQWEQR